MSKKITLNYFTGLNSTSSMFLSDAFNVNYISRINLDNNKYPKYLCINTTVNNAIGYDNIPCINMSNFVDSKQILLLLQNNIPIPNTIMSITHKDKWYIYGMSLDIRYITKPTDVARGMGKHVLYYQTYVDMIADVDKLAPEEFNSKYHVNNNHVVLRDEGDEYALYNAIKNGTLYLQEYIEDVSAEYRVLYFKGAKYTDFVVEHRVGYSPNSDSERKHTVVKCTDTTYMSLLPILKRLKEFGDTLPHPTLSFDVYVKSNWVAGTDNNDTWGVFEFSSEYGIDYPLDILHKLKKQFTVAMLKHVIPEYNKKYAHLKFI